ncbi:MarR family winged helix-turn-helix transcriptional regulator [Parvularcula marina]|uniref:MarR family transcriptional regulator n=1 Tax=Parvularcula marina TaxID=2292771 RepID=A0A371RI43_9PROT|nr:MarR family transcriptional regulator [Parvularcula marina]RFB05129.1 MarR family transcriptional regulator [Parvularcula marina]
MTSEAPDRKLMGLASIYEQVARAIYRERGPFVLQPAQWPVLRYLDLAGETARTASGIASFLGVELSTATRAAAALERRGFVSSRRNPDDRRVVFYELTDEGKTKLSEDPLQELALALGQVSQEDRSAFSRVVAHLADHLAQSKE